MKKKLSHRQIASMGGKSHSPEHLRRISKLGVEARKRGKKDIHSERLH